jgi:RNA polymerase sigma-70 factor (ECF subfamily)
MLNNPEEFNQDLRERDQESFAFLYNAYGEKIYNLAYRMTGNQADAEDITQETFLQAYRHIGTFREKSQIYTWIHAIAKNLCYRFFERQKKNSFASYEALIFEASKTEISAEINASEKQQLIGQVKDGCLTGLLRCLSFYQRIAFILHILLHLPVRDVSKILNKSEGATKVLIHRARLNLKLFLCKNCSLYDPANPCRCEDLLGFSLKQGWITQLLEPEHANSQLDLHRIEEEIKSIREVIEIYSSLDDANPSDALNRQLQELVRCQEWLILSDKKV